MATIIKYICDKCKREVSKKEELYDIQKLDLMLFYNSGEIHILNKEICINCFCDISSEI